MCLSHLIHTVRLYVIHACHSVPTPCSDHAVLLKATVQQIQLRYVSRSSFSLPIHKRENEDHDTYLSEFTAILTGHGLTRSYLHRFKIIPNSKRPCGLKEEQTINHIILICTQLRNERRILRNSVVRARDTWPPPFEQLKRNHIKTFTKIVRSIDFSAL